jgi:hypothetical protein
MVSRINPDTFNKFYKEKFATGTQKIFSKNHCKNFSNSQTQTEWIENSGCTEEYLFCSDKFSFLGVSKELKCIRLA